MAQKILAILLFFAVVVILPVHMKYDPDRWLPGSGAPSESDPDQGKSDSEEFGLLAGSYTEPDNMYLWMYVAFVYFFSIVAMYLLVVETRHIILVRQRYLGSQATVTDRTIRLSGIPEELRSEEKVKALIEDLDIGKVERVMLCRNWKSLDQMVTERQSVLRKLEEAWTIHLGRRHIGRERLSSLVTSRPALQFEALQDEPGEETELLTNEDRPTISETDDRPETRFWYGWLKMQNKKIDAIDYYEEKLRKLDDQIRAARKKEFLPMPLAFVTMDSVASCQMAVQAILDPRPMQLMATGAPAPADVVWENTYLSRWTRMSRAWFITFCIGVLTIIWSSLLVPLAFILNVDTIEKYIPGFARILNDHPVAKSLFTTGLPTLLLSVLTIAVPYLYYCKSFHNQSRAST